MVSPLKHRLAQIVVLVTGFWLLVTICFAQQNNSIRVAIIQNAPSVTLTLSGYYEISDLATGNSLYKGKNLRNARVSADTGGIKIGIQKYNCAKIKITPKKEAAIYINKRRFRGKINIILKDESKILVVNELNIEDYIKGVLYHEISPRWPLEAIKAQAVVARTYALYQAQMNKDKDFDMTSDIYSQVYGGKTSEKYRTNVGVDKTKGEFLTYQGQIFPAYYHATCAGHTEDASTLWNIDITPLKGVECKFCFGSPHIRWNIKLSLDQIRSELRDSGYNIGVIRDVIILERNSSDRIVKLRIDSDIGSLIISGKDFRQAIGPNIIRSTNFNVKISGGFVYFYGLGWGHGVGMCQWGAYFMAQKGFKYEQIIQYYYPQAKIQK